MSDVSTSILSELFDQSLANAVTWNQLTPAKVDNFKPLIEPVFDYIETGKFYQFRSSSVGAAEYVQSLSFNLEQRDAWTVFLSFMYDFVQEFSKDPAFMSEEQRDRITSLEIGMS